MKTLAIIFDLWDTLGTKNISISKTIADKFGFEGNYIFQKKYENAVQLKKWENLEEMSKNLLTALDVAETKENIDFTAKVFQTGIDNSVLYPGMEELLKKLNKNYILAILTNTTNFESSAPVKWGVDDIFKENFFSWQIGSLKPAEQNYKIIFQKLKIKPAEAIFIDDAQENVDAAKRLGIQAIKFQDVGQLENELFELNIVKR